MFGRSAESVLLELIDGLSSGKLTLPRKSRLEDPLPRALPQEQGTQTAWAFDVDDTGNEVVLCAEAPGFENDEFDILIRGDQLTIHAERKQEEKDKGNWHSYSERRLHRTVTVPSGIDTDKIEAHYRNGVLEIHVPKVPQAQAKRITVKS